MAKKKTFKRKTNQNLPRDYWYRKCNHALQDWCNAWVGGARFNKKQLRELRRDRDKSEQHFQGLSSFINDHLNPYLFNNKYTMYMQRTGEKILVTDYATKLETVFIPLFTTGIEEDTSLTNCIAELGELEKKAHLHFKRNYLKIGDYKQPVWVVSTNGPKERTICDEEYRTPQLNMKSGGFVEQGSWRNVDHVNCLLTKNEFVITAPAVRGLGKGSYALGAAILHFMQDIWKREARQYAHKR